MKTWECKECGKEIASTTKPAQPCSCGARGKWVQAASLALSIVMLALTACNGPESAPSVSTAEVATVSAPTPGPTSSPVPSPTVTPSPSPSPSPAPSATPYAFQGGSGVLGDPYRLYSATDVNHIRDYPSAYFQLMQTIDLASIANFAPIPAFSGVIYGQTFSLTNLKIAASGSATAAFIGSLSGTLTQLTFSGANVSSASGYAAVIAGTLTSTSLVSSCRVYGTITSPLGGNGYNVGQGTPFYVFKNSGANVTVSTSQFDVMFNGGRIMNPDRL